MSALNRQQRAKRDRRQVTKAVPAIPPWITWSDGVITGTSVRFARSGDVTKMVLNGVPPIRSVSLDQLPISADLDTNGLTLTYGTGLPQTDVFELLQPAAQLRTDLGGFLAPASQLVQPPPLPYNTGDWQALRVTTTQLLAAGAAATITAATTDPTRWATTPNGFVPDTVTATGTAIQLDFIDDTNAESGLTYTPNGPDTWTNGTGGPGGLQQGIRTF